MIIVAKQGFRCSGLWHVLGLLIMASCSQNATLQPAPPTPLARTSASNGGISKADIANEVGRLRAALQREVRQHITDDTDSGQAWVNRVKVTIVAAGFRIERTQLLIAVDRNPRVQELRIVLVRPDEPWEVIGGSKVSTGQAGRRGYFLTPVGVFLHTADILDYQALGTFNENHIRGLGLKGMRVWDFGRQMAEKGWNADEETGEIRLLMHATDPDYLEQRLGRPASKGCIRIPATMNRFLDIHGVLDADYERAALDEPRYAAILLPERRPTPLAGDALVIVDSSNVQP